MPVIYSFPQIYAAIIAVYDLVDRVSEVVQPTVPSSPEREAHHALSLESIPIDVSETVGDSSTQLAS